MDETTVLAELLVAGVELEPSETARRRSVGQLDALVEAARRQGGLRYPDRSRRRTRVPLRVLAAVVVALGACTAAWAAAGRPDLHLFASGPTHPTPIRIQNDFAGAKGSLSVDLGSVAPIGSFATQHGKVTVYAARTRAGGGFAALYATGESHVVARMAYLPSPRDAAHADRRLVVSSNSLNGMFDGVWQIWGTTPRAVARLELRYADGTTSRVPLHKRLFVFLADGERCKPGHEPVTLSAIAATGGIVDRANVRISRC
jgi:hypothetical protein